MAPKLSAARKAALSALIEAREIGEFETERVYQVAKKMHLEPRDKAFAVKLVRGVVSYRPALEFAIRLVCDKKTRLKKNVMDGLLISAYEICYLEKEKHVCVDQGVELVKTVSKNATGLANFILRRLDPNSLPKSVSLRLGFSDEFADFLTSELGENVARDFMQKSCLEPKIFFAENGARHGLTNLDFPSNDAIFTAAKKGDVIIADASAVSIAKSFALAVAENFDSPNILEVGAGRGTKTALIQSFLAKANVEPKRYDVLDSSEKRLSELKKRIAINEFVISNIYCEDAVSFMSGTDYHAIFIDSPCTGLGTLRRNPEIKSRFSVSDVEKFAKVDLQILSNVARLLARQGVIYYSTCTISSAENMGVIDKFLTSEQGKRFELVNIVRRPVLNETEDAHFCVCLKAL